MEENSANNLNSPQELTKPQQEEKILTFEDIEPFNKYLCSIIYSLIDVDRDSFYKRIHEKQVQEQILDYCQQQKNKLLIISKISQEEGNQQINISLEANTEQTTQHSIAFIKRQNFLISKEQNPTEFLQLIQVINLGYYGHDTNPISINHLYVQNCFIPVFNAYKNSYDKRSSSEKDQFQSLMKKINELNLALIQCQQNVDVPEIQLNINPVIKERIAQLKKEDKKISEDQFEDLMTPEFIEQLVNCVNKWTRDVSTVINISQKFDLSEGTALQEINYWQSYES
ncbi:hypothetical protein PPERSA_02837 [Pseudocohnilembus persalinus]|uniref:Uncharacterized protein n=1 Tax=Pseudocohnilembus persalinus TaxID=266149 RepID=A0A0V0QMH4_PSEPJ|nr:hypothetical protein PPERSA_02837 [Pseudocohnilembus persalinus]|eukprot:KRX03458.1 hypothetical protein PPERSA_02837 [Pseudocohnilembus persalinus]